MHVTSHVLYNRHIQYRCKQLPGTETGHLPIWKSTFTSLAKTCIHGGKHQFTQNYIKSIIFIFIFQYRHLLSFEYCHAARWTWVIQCQNVSILDFIGAKDDGGGGYNWSYKTCKAPVKSSHQLSPTINQHLAYDRPDAPTNSVKALNGADHMMINAMQCRSLTE